VFAISPALRGGVFAVALTRTPTLAAAIFEYLEIFHNRQRRHSALGWRSPIEYERLHTPDVA
jgi:transposase InsO family protein